MIDVLIFAIIAGLLFWKFKGMLGKEDEGVRTSTNLQKMKDITFEAKEQSTSPKVNFLESKKDIKEQKKQEVEDSIKRNIALLKPEFEGEYKLLSETFQSGVFDVKAFFDGIENIFIELIKSQNTKIVLAIESFATPEFTLKFQKLILKQEEGQHVELVKIENMDIILMKTENNINTIKLKIASEQIRFKKEGENIISGSVSIPGKFVDFLTIKRNFEKQIGNWVIHEIE
jgi:predicted lipid-binding transport protein (Tim44 family)